MCPPPGEIVFLANRTRKLSLGPVVSCVVMPWLPVLLLGGALQLASGASVAPSPPATKPPKPPAGPKKRELSNRSASEKLAKVTCPLYASASIAAPRIPLTHPFRCASVGKQTRGGQLHGESGGRGCKKGAAPTGNSIAAGPLSQSAFAPLGQRGAQKDGRVGKVDQRSQGGR